MYQQIRFGGPITPTIKWIIVSNVAIYLISIITGFGERHLSLIFGLIPIEIINYFAVYQLVTYMFLHGSPFHILINMLILWMFGGEIEYTLGKRKFLFYYFLCGIGAGIITTIVNYNSPIPVIGASGAIYGLLLAYGVFFPERIVLFMMIFPMRVKYMVAIFIAIEFLASISQTQDQISNITHLGGMAFGGIYLFFLKKGITISNLRYKIKHAQAKRKFKVLDKKDDDSKTLH